MKSIKMKYIFASVLFTVCIFLFFSDRTVLSIEDKIHFPQSWDRITPANSIDSDIVKDATAAAADAARAGAVNNVVWCGIVEEELPSDQCKTLASVLRGTGAYNAPKQMILGDISTITLVISRQKDDKIDLDSISNTERQERIFYPSVGRYIQAQIFSDPGLEIELDSSITEMQDLYASSQALWRWTITAKKKGDHQITLRTRVMTRLPNGNFAPKGHPFTDTRRITVIVEGIDAALDSSVVANRTFDAATSSAKSLTKFIVAFTALVVAVGGLWIAVRRFGKASKPDNGSDKI